jgi:hypothetical protein
MDAATHDLVGLSTCTTCQFSEDFSNYWTAVLYYKAKNGTFKRVPQMAQDNSQNQGGMVRLFPLLTLLDWALVRCMCV